jgi:hypothetical protein
MPHEKIESKQADFLSKSVKIGLTATAAVAGTPFIMSTLFKDSIYNSGGPGYPGGAAAGALTLLAAPVVGVLAAGVSELSMLAVDKYYKDFKNLPVAQQVALGLAAYNILVGTAVGGSFFVIANAAAREYLFDAALHFLNAYALNSDSKLINAIAFGGNIARMLQIDSVLSAGASTIPKALNFLDSSLNHPSTMFGLGMKCLRKSVTPEQPIVADAQASTLKKTM